jgi:hypothetical protein
MASHMDAHRPERVPGRMPARFPAWLRSWQGDPPVMMSTGSTSAHRILVMSPRLGTSGQWCARIRDGAISFSENHAGSASNTSRSASSMPP